jgi:hypothetical protein
MSDMRDSPLFMRILWMYSSPTNGILRVWIAPHFQI